MRWSGCSELPAVERWELRVDEWLRAKEELLDGLEGDVESRGTAGRRERDALGRVAGVRDATGRILPVATRPLRLAVLSLRFGALQPPCRSSDRGMYDLPSEVPIRASEAELLVRGGRRAVDTERAIDGVGRAVLFSRWGNEA